MPRCPPLPKGAPGPESKPRHQVVTSAGILTAWRWRVKACRPATSASLHHGVKVLFPGTAPQSLALPFRGSVKSVQ